MGCLFSKKSLSTSAFGDRSSTSTRVQHIRNSTSNGILRVPKKQKDDTHSITSYDAIADHVNNHHQLRMKPPPIVPPPSPPSAITTPSPEPTKPPTPEDERPPLHVQYAEDLESVTPLPAEKMSPFTDKKNRPDMTSDGKNSRSKETLDDKQRSRVSVSNVTLKPNVNGIRGAPMPLQDLSIEELDTEMDDFNRFSGTRYTSKKEDRINPVTTDILLPRRKEIQKVQFDIANTTVTKQTKDNSHKFVRKDTPYPDSEKSKRETKAKDLNASLKIDEVSKYVTSNSTKKLHSTRLVNEELTRPELGLTNSQGGKVMTFDMPKNTQNSKSTDTGDSLRKSDMKEKPGTLTDIHVQTAHELPSESHSIAVTKTMFEQDLDKIRKTRKRKRTRNRQSDYTPRSVTGTLNDKENEKFFEGSLKSLKGRPVSGTSTRTSGSMNSLGSTDTLQSFDMEADNESKQEPYSYYHSGTPISFRNFSDKNTEVIDLEDNGDLNTDLSLSQEPIRKEEQFDVWYGVKPYNVVPSSGRKDTGVVKTLNSGPSSSEMSTKQKLMYSKFARRPQSESVLRRIMKPPLPPGAKNKIRPVSDTVRTTHDMSRYYTTDLDIH